jgi:hypothetical protein
MILDAQNLFSDAQAVTAEAASTNSIDFGSARNIGAGEELYVGVIVDVALTDSGSDSTVTVALEGDSTTTFTPDGTQQLFIIPALAAIGSKYFAKISPEFASNFRYMQLKYTPNNGNLTAGSFTAFIVKNPDTFKAFADNITIS